jgi:hypothetical protein
MRSKPSCSFLPSFLVIRLFPATRPSSHAFRAPYTLYSLDRLFDDCVSTPYTKDNQCQSEGSEEVQPDPFRDHGARAPGIEVPEGRAEECGDECTREEDEGYGSDDAHI